jgi:hypothetical protein
MKKSFFSVFCEDLKFLQEQLKFKFISSNRILFAKSGKKFFMEDLQNLTFLWFF